LSKIFFSRAKALSWNYEADLPPPFLSFPILEKSSVNKYQTFLFMSKYF